MKKSFSLLFVLVVLMAAMNSSAYATTDAAIEGEEVICFPGYFDPDDVYFRMIKNGQVEFKAFVNKNKEVSEILFFRKSFLQKFEVEVKNEEKEPGWEGYASLFSPFSSADARRFLEDHLTKEGIKKEDFKNYNIYRFFEGYSETGIRWMGINFFEKKFRTLTILYYDKRIVLDKLSRCQWQE